MGARVALRDRRATTSSSPSSTARATSGTTAPSATTAASSSSPRSSPPTRRSASRPRTSSIAATHAHSSPDFIGGWGFVPDWYMDAGLRRRSSRPCDRRRRRRMRPATLEVGEAEARGSTRERRDTYRSAEEQQLDLAARRRAGTNNAADESIATLGAYAAHPTTFGTNGGRRHPDWPGLFETAAREALRRRRHALHDRPRQHVGLRARPRRRPGLDQRRGDLAMLGRQGPHGNRSSDPDIATARTTWQQPVTNVPLTALGLPGFFDRKFVPTPASVRTGEDPDKLQCASASRCRRRSPSRPRGSAASSR